MNLATGSHSRGRARVEIIPLIDCVFIILVFFIYSMLAMTIRRGVVVQLPQARSVAATEDDSIVITITEAGTLMIDDRAAGLDHLGSMLDRALAGRPTPMVLVNADASAEHGWFVRVMDELRVRGIEQVVVLTDEVREP